MSTSTKIRVKKKKIILLMCFLKWLWNAHHFYCRGSTDLYLKFSKRNAGGLIERPEHQLGATENVFIINTFKALFSWLSHCQWLFSGVWLRSDVSRPPIILLIPPCSQTAQTVWRCGPSNTSCTWRTSWVSCATERCLLVGGPRPLDSDFASRTQETVSHTWLMM